MFNDMKVNICYKLFNLKVSQGTFPLELRGGFESKLNSLGCPKRLYDHSFNNEYGRGAILKCG